MTQFSLVLLGLKNDERGTVCVPDEDDPGLMAAQELGHF